MSNYEQSGKIYINNFGKLFQTFLSLFDLLILFLKIISNFSINLLATITENLYLNGIFF